jgi:hypothetical protein
MVVGEPDFADATALYVYAGETTANARWRVGRVCADSVAMWVERLTVRTSTSAWTMATPTGDVVLIPATDLPVYFEDAGTDPTRFPLWSGVLRD